VLVPIKAAATRRASLWLSWRGAGHGVTNITVPSARTNANPDTYRPTESCGPLPGRANPQEGRGNAAGH